MPIIDESSSPIQFSNQFNFIKGGSFENIHTQGYGKAFQFLYEFTSLTCPDGRPARFRLITPAGWGTNHAAELVFVFFGGIYDNSRGGSWGSVSISSTNRLSAIWAHHNAEAFSGAPLVDMGTGTGTIVSALINENMASVILQNCWADMGYSRSYGPHANNREIESFARLGLEASEAILNEAYGQSSVSSIYTWGVSSGAQASLQLLDANKTKIAKIVVDAPSDYNKGYYDNVDALLSAGKIPSSAAQALKTTWDAYFFPIFGASSSTSLAALETNSLKYKLANDPDYLTKDFYYLYSDLDPVIPVEVSAPGAAEMENIKVLIPAIANQFCIESNSSLKHVQSNDDLTLATRIAKFLKTRTCP